MDGVTYRQAGKAAFPSPSIWADCPISELIAGRSNGVFFHENFLGGTASAAATGAMGGVGTGLFGLGDSDTDTVLAHKAAEEGGYQDIETDADDNDAAIIHNEPFCKIVRNSGNKVWLEARLELGSAAADQGFFFGLGEELCQTVDVIADNVADLITETLMGFRTFALEAALDFILQKDASAETEIVTDVTNSALLAAPAVLTTDTEMKLGLRFDGKQTISVYVNGVNLYDWTLDATYYDPTKSLCVVIALKTGANTVAVSMAIDWVRAAYEVIS